MKRKRRPEQYYLDKKKKRHKTILDKPVSEIHYVVVEEDLTKGQRIESFQILRESEGYRMFPLYHGRTVGNKRICQIWDSSKEQNKLLFRYDKSEVDHLVLRIISARGDVCLKSVKVY